MNKTNTSSNTQSLKRTKIISIAELGIAHGGSVDVALKMISDAASAGADIVKFQSYNPLDILGPNSPHLQEALAAQLHWQDLKALSAAASALGVDFGCSFFHPDQIEPAEMILNMTHYKVASRAATNPCLLREVNRTKKPAYVSVGLLDRPGINRALEALRDCPVTLLYCVCKYPCTPADFDMAEVAHLRDFGVQTGFSSHCPDMMPTLSAIGLGATVVENHVKPDTYRGCDAAASMDWHTYRALVKSIREIEANEPAPSN